jgi:CubicO group peptidase (beta-lactamase class C family)
MMLYSISRTIVLVAVMMAACAGVYAQEVSDAQMNAFVGRWHGVHTVHDGDVHSEELFTIEFARDGHGLVLKDHNRLVMAGDPARVSVSDGVARAEWQQIMQVSRSISARVVDDGAALEAEIGGAGFMEDAGQLRLRLVRSSAETNAYLAPRASADGRRTLKYEYTTPQHIGGSWPVATPESVRIEREPLAQLAREIMNEGDSVSDRHTEGVLIVRHGKLVFEEYFWGMRRELAHIIASDTKSVSSMLTGIAIDAGKLGLDDPVIDYFPQYRDRLWARQKYPIRVRDLLSMTAGVEWPDRAAATGEYMRRMLASPDHVGFVLDLPAVKPPGGSFNYNNGLPILLGEILTRALGEPVDAFADRQLFQPLGIRNYTWTRLRNGVPWLTGGMTMPPRDMAKIGQLMLAGGEWQGKRLISEDWVALSTARQTRADDYPYGFLWHLSRADSPWRGQPSYFGPVDRYDAFTAIGQGGQIIMVLPEVQVIVVIVSSNWKPGIARGFPTDLVNRYIIPAIR